MKAGECFLFISKSILCLMQYFIFARAFSATSAIHQTNVQ